MGGNSFSFFILLINQKLCSLSGFGHSAAYSDSLQTFLSCWFNSAIKLHNRLYALFFIIIKKNAVFSPCQVHHLNTLFRFSVLVGQVISMLLNRPYFPQFYPILQKKKKERKTKKERKKTKKKERQKKKGRQKKKERQKGHYVGLHCTSASVDSCPFQGPLNSFGCLQPSWGKQPIFKCVSPSGSSPSPSSFLRSSYLFGFC